MATLQLRLLTNSEIIAEELTDVIVGGALAYGATIATTRVPCFSDDMVNPMYGYRLLGPLSAVSIQMTTPPTHIDRRRELLAVECKNNITDEFLNVWGPLGVEIGAHFIIIFIPSFTSPSSSQSSLSSLVASRHASPALFMQSAAESRTSTTGVITRQPPNNFHTPSPYSVIGSVQDGITRSRPSSGLYGQPSPLGSAEGLNMDNLVQIGNIPSLGMGFTGGGTTEPNRTVPSQGNTDNLSLPENFSPGMTVPEVCRRLGIDDHTLAAATIPQGGVEKGLLAMVRTYRAMASIFLRIGLQERGVPFTGRKSKSVMLPGGLQLSAEDVARSFGWSVDSYKHKSTWFEWAENAAASSEWDDHKTAGE